MPFQTHNHKASKLTGEQVLLIRARYAAERGCTQAQLSREYGVSISTIRNILNGTTWQIITEGESSEKVPANYQVRIDENAVADSLSKLRDAMAEDIKTGD